MTQTISIQDFQARASEILAQVPVGDDIVLTQAGNPVAKVTPLPNLPRANRVPGRLKGKINVQENILDPLPDDVIELFYKDNIFP